MFASMTKYTGEGQEPTRGTAGAAAWDLYANEDVTLLPFEPTPVDTGLQIQIPEGHALLILPRSGNSLKKKLIVANSPGLIDEDYRGGLKVILTYLGLPRLRQTLGGTVSFDADECIVKKGDRIAQAFLVKYEEQSWIKVANLEPSQRGVKGLGSTGD